MKSSQISVKYISHTFTLAASVILLLPIVVLSEKQNFRLHDINPKRLASFNPPPKRIARESEIFRGKIPPASFTTQTSFSNKRHYNKGNVRQIHTTGIPQQRQRNERQGRNCIGVCRYIPDRDLCPTNVLPVAQQYDDEDYYSDEVSAENSEEYYDDEYYDDDYESTERRPQQRKSKLKPKRTESESKSGKAQASENLHIVYAPITRYAAVSAKQRKLGRVSSESKNATGATRKRVKSQRERRRLRQPRVIRERDRALEQEILIRWDRVVERGPFLGGDVVIPDGVALRPPNLRLLRNRWPDGEIPFTMDQSINECRQNAIFDAMDEIEEKTCIRFVERDGDVNFIDIQRVQGGCSSYVGMIGGRQHLNLSTGCFSKFTVTHELLHAIGMDHEQSRKDRDKYVEIDFDNVVREKEGQFELNPTFSGAGFPYDIRSIMHYSAFLFAKDKCEPTIYPVNEKVDICELGLGNGKGGMTDCDAAKINKMYKCSGRKYTKKCKVKVK